MENDLITIGRIGLTKLYLWQEAERIQTYPQALARLMEHPTIAQGATRRQIGEILFRLAYVKGRKPLRENVLTNVFGLAQVAPDKLVLRGINLFRRQEPAHLRRSGKLGLPLWETQDDLWLPTPEAVALGQAYAADPLDSRWQALLAEQFGRYEVRTRLLLILLARGARLVFPDPGFFAGSNRKTIFHVDGNLIPLFDHDAVAFNTLLSDHRLQTFSPWWQAEIGAQGYQLVPDFVLEGVYNSPPSTNNLSYSLRTSLSVFKGLGILAEMDLGWGMDLSIAARYLSPELLADLTGSTRPVLVKNPWHALHQALQELQDESGFVVAGQLAMRWAELQGLPVEKAEKYFDDWIRRGLYEDHIRLLEAHPGQPRMGRGLLGNPEQRRVRLSVSSSP